MFPFRSTTLATLAAACAFAACAAPGATAQPAGPDTSLAVPLTPPPTPPPAPVPARGPATLHELFLAAEDTFDLVVGSLDTLLVDAPRVTVAEIVRRIGERMAADEARMGDHAWTQVTHVVARENAGRDDDRTEYELVERLRTQRGGAFQRVRLREVERKFKDGRLDKEKRDDDIERDWKQFSDVSSSIPFTLEGADEYNYEILSRDLFGEHLVYQIRFAPKSRFKGLPTGTVWIDCNDFVIRRLEAAFTDGAPLPLFIKSVPWFKVRNVARGGFWVPQDAMAKIVLRRGLPGLPGEVELFVRLTDHVIDGVAYPDDAPSAGEAVR